MSLLFMAQVPVTYVIFTSMKGKVKVSVQVLPHLFALRLCFSLLLQFSSSYSCPQPLSSKLHTPSIIQHKPDYKAQNPRNPVTTSVKTKQLKYLLNSTNACVFKTLKLSLL